jgi:hypothetical protein
MLVANPVYESYDEIKKKYDGYCVYITHVKGRTIEPDAGEVLAYNEDIGALTNEIRPILFSDKDLGVHTTRVLKDTSGYGIIQVITHEN